MNMKQITKQSKNYHIKDITKALQLLLFYFLIVAIFALFMMMGKYINNDLYFKNKLVISYWLIAVILVSLCCATYDFINYKKGWVAIKIFAWFSLVLYILASVIFVIIV
ncbi:MULTISPECIES: hypothetical protein [unclassified Mycoplasma]